MYVEIYIWKSSIDHFQKRNFSTALSKSLLFHRDKISNGMNRAFSVAIISLIPTGIKNVLTCLTWCTAILYSIEKMFIDGFFSVQWYINVFYQTCYEGEISGQWVYLSLSGIDFLMTMVSYFSTLVNTQQSETIIKGESASLAAYFISRKPTAIPSTFIIVSECCFVIKVEK